MNIAGTTPCLAPAWDERERLAALAAYGILDTDTEPSFDGLAELAADIFNAPIAVVNLIADGRQWFKAEIGIGQRELPLDVSICRHAILQPGVFVVPDLTQDARFVDNPLVNADGGLRFYAGALLETPEGLPLGTVCVLDNKPRPEGISSRQKRALKTLAVQVMELLERRRSEAELRDNEARLSAIFSNAAVGLSEISSDGRFLRVNEELCRVLGRPRDELLSSDVDLVTFKEDLAETEANLARVIDTRAPVSFDKRYVRPDGELVWANSSLSRLDHGQGCPEAILAVTVDLTTRRKAEQALREQEETLRLATKAARMFVWETDQASGITTWSNGAAEVLGVPEQVLSRDRGGGTFFVAEADRERLTQLFEEAVANQVPTLTPEFLGSDGRAWRAEIFISYDDDGTPTRVFGITQDVTEMQRRQEQVRISEARLRGVLDGMAEGFVLMDQQFRILTINAEGLRQDGRSADEIIGQTHWEAFPGSEELEVGKLYRKAFADRVPVALEHGYRWPDGRVTWLDMRAYPTSDGLLAVFWRDVSDRKSAESQLAEKAAEFEALAENVSQLAWMANADGHIYWYNKRWYDYTGTDFPTMQGWGWREVHHPDHVDRIVEEVGGKWAAGEPWEGTYLLRGSDGVFRPFLTRAEPIFDSDGKLVRWFGTNTDISAQLEAEAQLRDLNETLEQRVADALAERKLWADVFASSDALIAALSPEHRFLALNDAYSDEFERIFGIRPKVGDSLTDLLEGMPEHREAALSIWRRALDGEEFTATEEFGDPDRARPYYELRFNPLLGKNGEVVGAFQYALDVTERLRDQAELAKAQDALRQSQKMEAIGQLTGGVAHDFNNLLTIIRSSADLLRRRELTEDKRRRYVDAISDTADRAAKLTGQLLAFARRQALKPEIFDAGDRVQTISDMLRTVVGSRVQLEVDTTADSCLIEADASQFETALVNLVVNARDAMEGCGTLRIKAANVELLPGPAQRLIPAGQFVSVSVSDTGHGIPSDKLDHIFEPFFTTKQVGKGTGLGLSQVYGFAKQSGGDVEVESKLGEGTTFTILLPRATSSAHSATNEQVSCADRIDGGGHILVVEDNETVGAFATQLLNELGYETTWAANAEHALELLAEHPKRYDAMFSDVVMPGMNGVDLARKVRRSRPDLPILLTSGYSDVLAQEQRHGFKLLHKPYSVEELGTLLRRTLRPAG